MAIPLRVQSGSRSPDCLRTWTESRGVREVERCDAIGGRRKSDGRCVLESGRVKCVFGRGFVSSCLEVCWVVDRRMSCISRDSDGDPRGRGEDKSLGLSACTPPRPDVRDPCSFGCVDRGSCGDRCLLSVGEVDHRRGMAEFLASRVFLMSRVRSVGTMAQMSSNVRTMARMRDIVRSFGR